MKVTLVFGALILAVLATAANGADCKGVITASNTERRSSPSKSSSVMSKLQRNEKITIGEVKKDSDQRLWYRTGYSGYVEAVYVIITQENGRSWCKLGQAPISATERPKTLEERERDRQQALAVLRWFSGFFRPQRY